MAAESEKPMPDVEVTARLQQNLPKWHLENGWIRRTYKTNSWKGTVMVIGTVGHLAEAAWHHPDITASYAWVEVRLMTHTAKGITSKDLELAKKIEEVIQWQPGTEGRGLEGTPASDMRFAYRAPRTMAPLALWVPAARRQARLRCWSAAFAAAFALPSGRLATPWT
ncbi:MAG: 4a-hydroxytetrahydrobiopterin dehydratase, partial [Hyphomicrobium sp.]|nr:4a-hydroxytetrahydrobiopterin dehydratase [Hyphomicrobium sp.]